MSLLFDRREFLGSAACFLPLLGRRRWGVPFHSHRQNQASAMFKISLAEWSLHRMLFAGDVDNLDFPAVAKREFGIDGVEYVNQFFKDKAQDTAYLTELKKRCRRQRRPQPSDHVRRRGRPGRPGRSGPHQGGREPLQVGRGGEVPRLPLDPRQRPVGGLVRRANGARRRRPAAARRVRPPSTAST